MRQTQETKTSIICMKIPLHSRIDCQDRTPMSREKLKRKQVSATQHKQKINAGGFGAKIIAQVFAGSYCCTG